MTRGRANVSPQRQRLAAHLHGIYALVEPERRPLVPFVEDLLAGGIRLFQVRAKNGIDPGLLSAVVRAVRSAGGVTIVNDDVSLATLADGVHLGQVDVASLDLSGVRQRLGDGIIGLSCSLPEEARLADPSVVDYLGAGPIFATGSKADAGPPIGVDGVRAVVDAASLPTAAIGGIDCDSLATVRSTGATMAAIISALANARDAAALARQMVAAWNA